MSRGRGSGGGRRALHLAEVVLQLQLAALGLALHHVPALVELLQAALQPLHAVPQAGEQQALPGLVDGLHGAGMGHHVVPQHLGTARGRQGQHLAPRWAPGPPPRPLQRCHHGTGTGERPGKGRPEQGLLSSKWHRAAARQQICCFVAGGLLGWGMDEAGATLPCMAPPQPTCTSQHPADGRHGTSVPGQGEGDSSLLPCCHRGRGRVLTPPAPNHRPAWPSHHRPGARRLAMGWAVPGAGGSSALRHNTAPQQEDLERDCTVQWDPTAGLCPVPLEARSLGAARDGACRGPRATAALTLCLASSISQLCRSRRSSVGPCSCSEVWDSHCSSSSSWCWNCPRPSRAASSWCCRRQGQDQAPDRWGARSALPTCPAPCTQPHAPTLLRLSPCACNKSGHQLTRPHRLPELPPQPCPVPGTAPHCPSPLTWRLTISSSRRSQRCRKSLSGAGGSPCPCPPGPAWCRRLSTSTLHW